MIDIYSHITMEDVEKSYLSASYDKTQRRLQTGTKLCPRCGFLVNENFNFCPRCGQSLSTEASIELLRRENEIEEAKALIDRLIQLALTNPDILRSLLRGAQRRGKV